MKLFLPLLALLLVDSPQLWLISPAARKIVRDFGLTVDDASSFSYQLYLADEVVGKPIDPRLWKDDARAIAVLLLGRDSYAPDLIQLCACFTPTQFWKSRTERTAVSWRSQSALDVPKLSFPPAKNRPRPILTGVVTGCSPSLKKLSRITRGPGTPILCQHLFRTGRAGLLPKCSSRKTLVGEAKKTAAGRGDRRRCRPPLRPRSCGEKRMNRRDVVDRAENAILNDPLFKKLKAMPVDEISGGRSAWFSGFRTSCRDDLNRAEKLIPDDPLLVKLKAAPLDDVSFKDLSVLSERYIQAIEQRREALARAKKTIAEDSTVQKLDDMGWEKISPQELHALQEKNRAGGKGIPLAPSISTEPVGLPKTNPSDEKRRGFYDRDVRRRRDHFPIQCPVS